MMLKMVKHLRRFLNRKRNVRSFVNLSNNEPRKLKKSDEGLVNNFKFEEIIGRVTKNANGKVIEKRAKLLLTKNKGRESQDVKREEVKKGETVEEDYNNPKEEIQNKQSSWVRFLMGISFVALSIPSAWFYLKESRKNVPETYTPKLLEKFQQDILPDPPYYGSIIGKFTFLSNRSNF